MRVVVGALVLLLLALPSAVGAKEPLTSVAVCGAITCSESRDADLLAALWSLLSPTLGAAPPASPFVELRGSESSERLGYFVPGSDVVLWGWPQGVAMVWGRLPPSARAELERAAAAVELRPRPALARVIVNGRRVQRPARYLPLWGQLQQAPRPRARGPRWIPVTFVWKSANPWSIDSSMFYDRDDRALYRGGTWYRVPRTLGRMIVRSAFAR
jgi:hypothetical protein